MKNQRRQNASYVTLTNEQIDYIGECFSDVIKVAKKSGLKPRDFRILESLFEEVCEIRVSISKVNKLLEYVDINFDETSSNGKLISKYLNSFVVVTGSKE